MTDTWIGGHAFRAWFAEHTTTDPAALSVVGRFGGINQNRVLSDGRRSWVLRWRSPQRHRQSIAAEFRALDVIHRRGLPVPRPVAYCDDPAIVPAPCYVMEHVDGATAQLPEEIRGRSADDRRRRSEQLADTLAAMRALDVSDLADVLVDRSEQYAIDKLVEAWTDVRVSTPELDALLRGLEELEPGSSRLGLVHGDLHPFNVLLRRPAPSELLAVLDWETVMLAHSVADLAHLLMACDETMGQMMNVHAVGTPDDGFFDPDVILCRYVERTGEAVVRVRYFQALDAARLAVFAAQVEPTRDRVDEKRRAREIVDAAARHGLACLP